MPRHNLENFIKNNKPSFTKKDQDFLDKSLNEHFHYRALRALSSGQYQSHVEIDGVPIGTYSRPSFFIYARQNPFILKREFLIQPEVQTFISNNFSGLEYHQGYTLRHMTKHYIGAETMLQTMILAGIHLEQNKSPWDFPQRIYSATDFYEKVHETFLSGRRSHDLKHPVTPELINIFYDNYAAYLNSKNKLTPDAHDKINRYRAEALSSLANAKQRQQEDLAYQELRSQLEKSDLYALLREAYQYKDYLESDKYNAELVAKIKPLKVKLLTEIDNNFKDYSNLNADEQDLVKAVLGKETARVFKSWSGVTNSMKKLAEICRAHENAVSSSTCSTTPGTPS